MPKVARSRSDRIWASRNSTASLPPPPPMIVVLSAVTRTCEARPSCATVIVSRVNPECLDRTAPPVSAATSSSLCSRLSPKPGARTATHWKIPFTWL